ncbi:50S ribosomal protein L22 [Spiroplasma endosymbiont of Amphibalanus improvisus]|uniref:50S ribosomal protein L22 n=1 Tax=Spiroplasma endosymbiont of Amphibalanus improvisus TaxID=3066327 RepID=UPI00313D672A
MDAQAHLKMIRISPRKVRLVVDTVRNQNVGEALKILENTNKRSALPIKKLLNSSIANAVNNNGLDTEKLFIKEIFVNEGPTLKRFRPRAHGRSYQILKRTSNVTIKVSDTREKINKGSKK